MTRLVVQALFPVALVVGAALVAKGYAQVGDGFSAGATAGLGALLLFVGTKHADAARTVGARHAAWMIGGGLLLALAVVLGPALLGLAPVLHAPRPGATLLHLGVLELHTAVLFDVGIAVLVYGALVATFDRYMPEAGE